MSNKVTGDTLLKKIDDNYNYYTNYYKPKNAKDFFELGVSLSKKNKFEDAINAFKQALNLKPDYFEAYFNIGVNLYHTGKYYHAIEVFNKIISIDSNFIPAYDFLAVSISKGTFLEAKWGVERDWKASSKKK